MASRPRADMQTVIEVQDLQKTFDGLNAVDGVNFTVAKGEFFGLLGPNGAGKTTTIRMLYGFAPKSAGLLKVFGMNIDDQWRRIKFKIGVCQQENTLDPDLTVEQNLLIFAGYFSISRSEAVRRSEELLDFFALSHRKDAKVMELSGGMARRLILARSLINRPDLLILDEPTTGLDPQSRHQVWQKLEALKETGLTMLITTHYMEEAARLCDRLVIIDHGRILVDGPPRKLIEEHAGNSVIEIDSPETALRDYAAEKDIPREDLGRKLILYVPDSAELNRTIRERFCHERCTFRSSTLEDVFLRLTGRELRE